VAALGFNDIELPCVIITVKCNQDGHKCVCVVYIQLLSMSVTSVCVNKTGYDFFFQGSIIMCDTKYFIVHHHRNGLGVV
jgi:hypothetical protein